ncbi:MAG: aminotransferase class V-fold PLP-dependent enzyme [Bacteroidales bacterium]|nr:aminotransferase class V-fold PLP-dependent enzyme [Bacteroidales bacterium]
MVPIEQAKEYPMTLEQARKRFPQLEETVYGKPLVYLDHAATSLRPLEVVRCWEEVSFRKNANLHRAVHYMAQQATAAFEEARATVASFLGAASPREIVFTPGATAAANLLATCLGQSRIEGGHRVAEPYIGAGDCLLVAESEHHSNLVPWQMLCERTGARLVVLPVEEDGSYNLTRLEEALKAAPKLFCIAHISNVLGLINPIAEMAALCHRAGCRVVVDGAQGIVHADVNVCEMGADYYFFSGHKIYAAPGTGVLWARAELLDELPPYMGGGEMIDHVRWEGSTWAEPPYRFEAGTQNLSGVPTLVPALRLLQELRGPEMLANALAVRDYVWEQLLAIQGLRLYGNPSDRSLKVPIFSFSIEGVHHEDLALLLDKMGVAVRSGQMCAEPLMGRIGVTGMVRASFAPFNTLQEAETFIKSLHKAIGMLR